MTATRPTRDRSAIVFLIGLFRLFKAVVLLAAGVGALGLLRPQVAEKIRGWLETIPYAGEHSWLRHLIAMISGMDEKRAIVVAIAAFSYAALFTVEGIGLILDRTWAEWLTVVATASFIPFEAYELIHRASAMKGGLLIVNIAIVIFLIVRLRRRRRGHATGDFSMRSGGSHRSARA